MTRVQLTMPPALFTASSGGQIPQASLYPLHVAGDAYESVASDARMGLQLDMNEWGRHAYVLRHHVFSEDVVARIEGGQADDFYDLAERLGCNVDNLSAALCEFGEIQFNPGFIALRAAAWVFANRHHDDPGVVRVFGTRLNAIRFESPLWFMEDTNNQAIAVYRAFAREAVAHPEVMTVLERLAYGKDGAAETAVVEALRSASGKGGGDAGRDTLSLGASLLENNERGIETHVEWSKNFLQQQADELRTFNESPLRDAAVHFMIEDPQKFVELFGYLSLLLGHDTAVWLLANCDHPQLNEAIASLFDFAQCNDAAFALMCWLSKRNPQAHALMDGMEEEALLSHWQRDPDSVGPLADASSLSEASGGSPGSIAAALAKLDALDMPGDEGALQEWAMAGSKRAREMLIQRKQEESDVEDDEDDVADGDVISLLELLKPQKE